MSQNERRDGAKPAAKPGLTLSDEDIKTTRLPSAQSVVAVRGGQPQGAQPNKPAAHGDADD